LTQPGEVDPNKEITDRYLQITLEWWKTVYDFYKHLMTVTVTSIGGFGALLAAVYQDSFGPNANLVPQLCAFLTFVAFIYAAYQTLEGMTMARGQILHMRDAATTQAVQRQREQNRVKAETIWTRVQWSYAVGVMMFLLFLISASF
jgi:hypothetical protein